MVHFKGIWVVWGIIKVGMEVAYTYIKEYFTQNACILQTYWI